MHLRPALLTLAVLACTAACTPKKEEAATPAPAPVATPAAPAPATPTLDANVLAANVWTLQGAVNAQGQPIAALQPIAGRDGVKAEFKDGRVSFSGGCNRMGGSFQLAGDTLTFAPMASTQMACPAPIMAIDQALGTSLQGAANAQLAEVNGAPQLLLTAANGDKLTFAGAPTAATRYGGEGTIVFLEVAPQRAPCSHPLIPNMQCLQVREITFDDKGIKTGTPGKFEPMYQEIEGFKHEDGVRNVVRVKRYDIQNPPADASNKAYVLDMVVESETVR